MRSEYLSYLERDEQLYSVVEHVLPNLQTLSAQQVETFVFYLKSLHAYYPASENHVEHYGRFTTQLDAIRNSKTQNELQRKAARLLLGSMVVSGASAVALLVGAVTWMGGSAAIGALLVAAAMGLFLWADAGFAKRALVVAKEQDRRYFLECIRAARACNELDWAGLFTYSGANNPGPQSDEDIERAKRRVAELSSQLRSALYNDEYMQYSPPRDPERHGR